MDRLQTYKLGEWLPDLPYYENTGLVEALNCLPVDGQYAPYQPAFVSGSAITNRPQGAISVLDSSGNPFNYVGDSGKLYVSSGTNWTASAANYACPSGGWWSMASYGSLLIATDYADVPQAAPIGGAVFAALATSGIAPNAQVVGVIGQFVMLGNTNDANGVLPHRVQWSSLNQPQNWPTPGSATAIATQAGAQTLRSEFGAVTGILGTDQTGLIFQKKAIVRAVYQGGNVVFSFDTYEQLRGGWFPNATVRVGQLVYFIAEDGFYFTDGTNSTPIGKGKVDRTFLNDVDQTYIERVRATVDVINKVITWCYPSHGASNGLPDRVVVYNYAENRWTHSQDTMQLVFSGLTTGYTLDALGTLYPTLDSIPLPLDSAVWQGGLPFPALFNSNKLGNFSGTPATATFQSGEFELNEGGRAVLEGVRPLVTGNPSSITVSYSSRDTQDNSSQSWSMGITPNIYNGLCDIDRDTKFLAVQMVIAGGFTKAMGAQFVARPQGKF